MRIPDLLPRTLDLQVSEDVLQINQLLTMPAGAFIAQVVHITDPVAYAASVILIVAACLIAAWIPATRAARVDPMVTLRQN